MNDTLKKFFIIGCTILIVILIFILVVTFVFRTESPVARSVQKGLHLPAIIVDNTWISVNEIEENTQSIQRFYENQDFSQFGIRIDFSTDDGKKRLKIQERKMINKLIEDVAVEQLARKYNITISDEAVRTAMERPMSSFGTSEAVKTRLGDLYGWSLEDFGEKVVHGQLLREKVSARFVQENAPTEEMQEKIAQAKKELDDGRIFSDVAQKYSEGQTAGDGGIMGWFREEQLQDEIGQVISGIGVGEHSDILETSRGLHVVRVNDISDTDGQKLYHISQIIVWKNTFSDHLSHTISNMNVREFLSEYVWDQNTGYMIFSDETMNEFEEKTRQEALEIQKQLLNN
jgi:parvulin-like peptidyl-prolyl isomerase